ncbi:cytochrome P450 [Streptomyces sp. NPDC053048]|uniref:cytochrome P450 n=1 Tax=Streptomyces sp. NPDC053048 TaxID=3365694 RepID=UPI0037D46227
MTTRTRRHAQEELAALLSAEGRRNPYPRYEALRAHGDVVRVKDGLLAVLGHAACARALRESGLRVQDAEGFDLLNPRWRAHSSLRGWARSMLYRNAPDHTRLRRAVAGSFTPRHVARLEPAVERLTEDLLDHLADLGAGGRTVDFMDAFAYRLPVAVISELLGVPRGDQGWFRAVAADVTIALEGITSPSGLERADAAMDDLSAYFARLIAHRRAHPADDLVSALAGQLDEQELTANLVLLLSAGFDTTTHLLGHGLHHALARPRWAARLRTEPGFAPGYVEETLRYEPPVQATSRWAAHGLHLLDTPVPAGTKVLVVLGAGNRDPRRFHRPQLFDPDRPDNQPLSFGGGFHFCLGAGLARMEARVALPRLLRRFPALAPAGPEVYRDRWLVRGHETFPVRL